MVERRKHKRYSMPRGTFVILRNECKPLRNHTNMSIGEIAMILYKSQPAAMGQVTNLSIGGTAFGGDTISIPDAGNVQLDLLMTEQGIYVHNIPYAIVPIGTRANNGKKPPETRTNALCFKHLDAETTGQLQDLLVHRIG